MTMTILLVKRVATATIRIVIFRMDLLLIFIFYAFFATFIDFVKKTIRKFSHMPVKIRVKLKLRFKFALNSLSSLLPALHRECWKHRRARNIEHCSLGNVRDPKRSVL